jgi:6-phospho-beta-glucosidase
MNRRVKLVVVGGSALSTPLLFETMARSKATASYDVVLLGRNPENLRLVERVSRELLKSYPEVDIQIAASRDPAGAFEGVDFCIDQIRVGGLEARVFDETFPRQFGIPGEETVGAGGFSSACRGIPVVLELCRMIAKGSPKAVVLNLTNPSSLVQYAIRKYTSLRVVGTCDAPVTLMGMIAQLLAAPVAELDFELGGMHHFTWITDVRHGGVSRLAEVLGRLEEMPKLPVDPEIVRAIGAIPSAFFRYFFHPDRVLAATEGRPVRASQLMAIYEQMLGEYRRWKPGEPPRMLALRGAIWYEKIVAPTLLALAEGRSTCLALSVDNNGTIPCLPDEAIIEAMVPIERGKLGKPLGANLPQDAEALLARNCAYEMLATEAIADRDRPKALRALMSNVMISSFNQARGVLDLVWPTEAKYQIRVELPAKERPGASLKMPKISYGDHLLEKFELPEERYALVTMEEPWELARPRLAGDPSAIIFVRELDAYGLEKMDRAVPEVDAVVGLGGGTPTDAAKYLAWRRHLPVDVIPSITSVDAPVTKSIASRAAGHVTYIGHVVSRRVIVDFNLIQAAPPRLNRSGVGDILCAHVALWDWRLAHERGLEGFDPSAADTVRMWLDRIVAGAEGIRDVTREGIRLVMQAFEDINRICRLYGSSRPQEGSDHTFAYNAEFQTRRSFLHGELIGLGAFVMASLQDNDPGWLVQAFARTGLSWQPAEIGLTKDEFVRVLSTLNWYQRSFGRRYSILDSKRIDQPFIERMLEQVKCG